MRPGQRKRPHLYAWLWEPLESDPAFILRPMFGGRAVYLDGKLMLYFCAKTEPWRGLLLCTERTHHESLLQEFPDLIPHPELGKWLYLAESKDTFECLAQQLVTLAGRRDPRVGILPKEKKRKRPSGAS